MTLTSLFNATGGKRSWRKTRGWEDGSDNLVAWEGVSVNASGRVIGIEVMGNNLQGNIPDQIWDLTELESLNLGKNKLTGDVPSIPGNRLGKLTVLNLGTNNLTGNLPDLHLFPNLEEVDLSSNQFTGPLSENIISCEKLKILCISSNQLEGRLPSGLGKLINLSKLDISNNKFSAAIPEEYIGMRNLTVFKVESNDDLTKPASAGLKNSAFYRWMLDRKLNGYLDHLNSVEIADGSGDVEMFPIHKIQQGVLHEGPHSVQTGDCLGFDDYADVLVARLQIPEGWPVGLGIFAQWGAGKSTLCDKIIERLEVSNPDLSRQDHWFVRLLWTTPVGAVLYGLAAVFIQVSGRCCRSLPCADALTARASTNTAVAPDVESGDGGSTSSRSDIRVKSIVASFDAWLFADSEVLWAVLVSKIFEQMEECFGEGAVRATRVQHAVSDFTCKDWCTVAFWSAMLALVAAAAGWVAELIARLDGQLERALASLALTGVPLAVVLWVIKAIPMLFKSQGEIILGKAEAMGESVGLARLGFMAEVEEEMQILLEMLKSKSTEKVKYLLVVSIDNLDRCPHRQVVKVLEAVHLFLERKKVNVAVMLALDPRLIIAAIEKDMGEGMCQEVSGSEYLDKIIHWPFCIPGGTKNERAKLLHEWLQIQGGRGDKASEESTQGEGGSQQPREGGDGSEEKLSEVSTKGEEESASANQPGKRGDGSEEKLSEVSTKGEERSASANQPGKRGDEKEEKSSDVSTKGEGGPASANQPGKRGATTGGRRTSGMSNQTSFRAHTSVEVEELEEMLKNTAPTPRKAKRVYNIYSIQRELAMKRAEKNDITFSRDDARKLLRWTIMAEFWPFYTACLAAIITREKQHLAEPAETIQSMFTKYGEEFLAKIFEGKPLLARNGEGHIGSYAATGARRLMGMDEDYEGFFQLLASKPQLVVGDFDEDKLGLLRLSINLNPAMVAKVTSWSRSKYN